MILDYYRGKSTAMDNDRQLEEPASLAVNVYNFSDGAAFAATATQEDNLLGGGSLSNAGLPGGSARNVRSVAVQTNMNIDRVT